MNKRNNTRHGPVYPENTTRLVLKYGRIIKTHNRYHRKGVIKYVEKGSFGWDAEEARGAVPRLM